MTSPENPDPASAATAELAAPTVVPAPEPTESPELLRTEPDAVLAGAVDLARAAALAVGGSDVGEHLGARPEPVTADQPARIMTHAFAATLAGYVGWFWAVTLARPVDEQGAENAEVTVDEVVLLPGDGALLAPAWVPWEERVRPGDLSPGDLLPPQPDDLRLVPAYTLSDDPAVEAVAFELGLGRERVLSRDGRLLAADRWYAGDRGPGSPMARQAPAHCGTCGFYLPLAGSLRAGFGVCGNDVTDSDGQVVTVEYGCGAHSQTTIEPSPLGDSGELVYDDGEDVSRAT